MRASLFITCNTYHSLTQVWRISEEGNTLGLDRRRRLLLWGFYCFGADSISEEVAGFSPLWFPQEKLSVSLVSFDVLVFDCCTCYSLSKDPNFVTYKARFLNKKDEAFGFLCLFSSRDFLFHL